MASGAEECDAAAFVLQSVILGRQAESLSHAHEKAASLQFLIEWRAGEDETGNRYLVVILRSSICGKRSDHAQ